MIRCYCCSSDTHLVGDITFGPEGQTVKQLYLCPDCGHRFLWPIPESIPASTFAKHRPAVADEPDEHSTFDTVWGRNLSNLLLLQMHYQLSKDSLILEIGPGQHGTFREIRRAGYPCELHAFEPCEHFHASLVKLGVNVIPDVFDRDTAHAFAKDQTRKPNVIISSNQIYFHSDPKRLLQLMESLLAPGGFLLLLVPNRSSGEISHSDQALHWFSISSLKILIEQLGLPVVFFNTCGEERSNALCSEKLSTSYGWTNPSTISRIFRYFIRNINRFAFGSTHLNYPFTYIPGFSPAIAFAQHPEFRYGGDSRYQIKVLLRKNL